MSQLISWVHFSIRKRLLEFLGILPNDAKRPGTFIDKYEMNLSAPSLSASNHPPIRDIKENKKIESSFIGC